MPIFVVITICVPDGRGISSLSLLSISIIRNVKQAIEILTDKDGIGMPKSKITVSTSGVAPGLAKLAELGGISLAISLHATNDNLRDEIVPINKYVGWITTGIEYALDWHERKTERNVLVLTKFTFWLL